MIGQTLKSLAASLLLAGAYALMGTRSADAQILPLNFDGGTGTTGVDQYTGAQGSGWLSGWQTTFHSGTTNGVATINSVSPLSSGGGDYLQLSYDALSNAPANTSVGRTARQWDISAVPMAQPFTLEFTIRSLVSTGGSNQVLILFGSTQSTSNTGPSDSWKLFASSTGWYTFSGPAQTTVPVANTPVLANETWNFKLTINPVTDTFSVAARNLTTNSAVFSVDNVGLRNGADAALSWLNFNALNTTGATGQGFAIDSVSITSVPEPGAYAVALGGFSLLISLGRLRRQRAG